MIRVLTAMAIALLAAAHASAATGPGDVRAAVDPLGTTHFVWTSVGGIVQTQHETAGGVRGPIVDVSAPQTRASKPQVAVDGRGRPRFAWVSYDGDVFAVQTRRRTSAGTLGPVRDVSPSSGDADQPQLAVRGAGAAYVAWTHTNGTFTSVVARCLSARGVLGPVMRLSRWSEDAGDPQVAISGAGARVVWTRLRDGVRQTRRLSATGELGPIRDL